jgi:predicted MPP superfamily phosphohydrolase
MQITVAISAVSSLIAILITYKFSNSFASILNLIGGYIFLFLFYLFVFLLLFHIVQTKWNLPLVATGVTALSVAFIIISIAAALASSFVVTELEIKIKNLKNKLIIMQISDLHLGHHRGKDYLTKIVEETNKRNPDLVLITGDLVDAKSALLPGVLEPLSNFIAPVYYVEGNHEKYIGAKDTLRLIEEQKVRVMHNEVIETNGIQLVGLDYMNADEDTFDMHPSDNAGTVKSALAEISLKNDVPSVLMTHSPVGAKYAEKAGISLMLSGHTHAGQIFPISLLAKIPFPLNRGLYQMGNTKVYVSSGSGTFMVRARLGSLNEINMLTLVPDN